MSAITRLPFQKVTVACKVRDPTLSKFYLFIIWESIFPKHHKQARDSRNKA
jgi:hypothetical protein